MVRIPSWLYWLIFAPIPIGIIWVVIAYFRINQTERCGLDRHMGPATWNFSQSWASNITAVGALLGTILTAGFLPDETALPKATYAYLNFFFGVLVVVAPFVYTAVSTPVPVHKRTPGTQAQFQGFVAGFIVAAGLTMAAVLGELCTIFLLFNEIQAVNSVPGAAEIFVGILLAIAGVLVFVYTWVSVQAIIKDQCKAEREKSQRQKAKRAELISRGFAAEQVPAEQDLTPDRPPWPVL
jgi:succinate dehydrogenase hydrophobic anchor subunit